jgi:hypothetical protein
MAFFPCLRRNFIEAEAGLVRLEPYRAFGLRGKGGRGGRCQHLPKGIKDDFKLGIVFLFKIIDLLAQRGVRG